MRQFTSESCVNVGTTKQWCARKVIQPIITIGQFISLLNSVNIGSESTYSCQQKLCFDSGI